LQTRYHDEEATNLVEIKTGHNRILSKEIKKADFQIYDVTKGRDGHYESLPKEHFSQRVLPKPPSLSQLCV
jgi:hypothetical protein